MPARTYIVQCFVRVNISTLLNKEPPTLQFDFIHLAAETVDTFGLSGSSLIVFNAHSEEGKCVITFTPHSLPKWCVMYKGFVHDSSLNIYGLFYIYKCCTNFSLLFIKRRYYHFQTHINIYTNTLTRVK